MLMNFSNFILGRNIPVWYTAINHEQYIFIIYDSGGTERTKPFSITIPRGIVYKVVLFLMFIFQIINQYHRSGATWKEIEHDVGDWTRRNKTLNPLNLMDKSFHGFVEWQGLCRQVNIPLSLWKVFSFRVFRLLENAFVRLPSPPTLPPSWHNLIINPPM